MNPTSPYLLALLLCAGLATALAQDRPAPPPGAEGEEFVLDGPERRPVDTLDAELPASGPEPVDTSAGFFRKVFQPGFPNPERAAALSFVLPGAGQVYNKRFAWLKVPVIATGYGLLIYSGEFNRDLKNRYDAAYEFRLDEANAGIPTEFDRAPFFTDERTLRIRRDEAGKNFQLSYIGLVLFHLVQTLEAYTTAHLLEFDMDESLSLQPSVAPPPAGVGPVRPALTLTWRPQGRLGR